MLDWLADRMLRIDARSLGLFRIGMGLTLLCDLFGRWRWLDAFYSNDGVLPNHNHLFLMPADRRVWSVLHACSSSAENHTAFLVLLFVYGCFLVGWHTRVFQVLSVVALVSLTGRNIMLENTGNSVAIALLGLSALLPLGQRFSIDSLTRSFSETDEKTPDQLNRRGWSEPKAPASLAGLGLVLVLGSVHLFAGLQQSGEAWKDGTALHYALHVDRWASGLGVVVRGSSAATGALTRAMRLCELGVLALALVPVARRWTRLGAVVLAALPALILAALFDSGLHGWTLVSACALLVPAESWDAMAKGKKKATLYYDDDCGVCLWLARLLVRMDLRHNVTVAANSGDLPDGVTREMVDRSMVVIGPDDKPRTDADAVIGVMDALPLMWILGLVLRVPGLYHLTGWLYRAVARRRMDLSTACGLAACGVSQPGDGGLDDEARAPEPPSPGAVWWRRIMALAGNAAAVALLASFVAQSEKQGSLPFASGLGNVRAFTAIADWSQMMAPWGFWSPEPPKDNGVLVVDAVSKSGIEVDLLTRKPSDLELVDPGRARLGALWASYTDRIRRKEYEPYRQEFRRYVSRGGAALDSKNPDHYVTRFTATWRSVATPPPGQARSAEVTEDNILGHGAVPPPPRPDGPRLKSAPNFRSTLK